MGKKSSQSSKASQPNVQTIQTPQDSERGNLIPSKAGWEAFYSNLKKKTSSKVSAEQTFNAGVNQIADVVERRDGSLAIIGYEKIKIWNRSGDCLDTFEGYDQGILHSVAELSGGRLASYDGKIKILNLKTGVWEHTFNRDEDPVIRNGLLTLKDNCLAIGWASGKIDIRSGETDARLVKSFQSGDADGLSCFTELTDGRLVSGYWSGTIKVWNQETGRCLQTIKEHKKRITSIIALEEGGFISASAKGAIKYGMVLGFVRKHLRGQEIPPSLLD